MMKSKFRDRLICAVPGALLLILSGVIVGCENAGQPKTGMIETPTLSSKLPTETPLSPEMREISKYQEELKNNHLSEEMRQSILNKIELLSSVVTQRAMIEETSIITPHITLGSSEDSQLPTGLREGGTSDFHAWEAHIHNIWSGYSDNGEEHYTVYAGELGSGWEEQAGRGVVYMLRRNVKSRNGNRKQYLLSEGTGWVRISEILGDYIVLASKEGQTFYFYLPGQQFVDSLDEVAPTVTPLPTPGPRYTLGPEPDSPYPFPLPTLTPYEPYPTP